MKQNNRKGFTLVEIMIVVVIIGLLAAMAIPAFQKVRQTSIEKSIVNDGRQIGAAAQQYMMEHGVTSVSLSIGSDGEIGGPLSDWVSQVAAGTAIDDGQIDSDSDGDEFTLTRGDSSVTFDEEGRETTAGGGGGDENL